MATATTNTYPLLGGTAAPYARRSKYLEQALLDLQKSSTTIRSGGELALRLLANGVLQASSSANDKSYRKAQSDDLASERDSVLKSFQPQPVTPPTPAPEAVEFSQPKPEPSALVQALATPPGPASALPTSRPSAIEARPLADAIPSRDADLLARTVIGEAGRETDAGQQAVAQVALNRANASGKSLLQVLTAKNQFEPITNKTTRARLEAIPTDSPQYQRAMDNLSTVVMERDQLPPQIDQATHFYSPTAQAQLAATKGDRRAVPSWDNGTGVDLGRHRFFNLGYGNGPPPQQMAAAVPPPPPPPPGGFDLAQYAMGAQPFMQQGMGQPPQMGPQGPMMGGPSPMPQQAPQGAMQPYQVAQAVGGLPPMPMQPQGPQMGAPMGPQAPQQQFNPNAPTPDELGLLQRLYSDPRTLPQAREYAFKLQQRQAQRPEYDTKVTDQGQLIYAPNAPGGQPVVSDIPGYRQPLSGNMQYGPGGRAQAIPGTETRTLTPQEVQVLGLPPGSVVQADAQGNLKITNKPAEGYEYRGGSLAPIQGGPADPNAARRPPEGWSNGVAGGRLTPVPGGPAALQAETQMRDSFEKEPAYRGYQRAAGIWDSMFKQFSQKNRISDLNSVYGTATIFDPDSVVREGEQVVIRNAQALPDWLVGQINRVNGGQGLSDEMRYQLLESTSGRIAAMRQQLGQRAQFYGDIAQRQGLDQRNIVPPLPEFQAWSRPRTQGAQQGPQGRDQRRFAPGTAAAARAELNRRRAMGD